MNPNNYPFLPSSLVAFTGLKGSGKDTAAKILIEKGFVPVQFAAYLKNMIMSLIVSQGGTIEEAHELTNGSNTSKETPSVYFNNRTARHAMQTLGTEWGRNFLGEDFWVNCVRTKLLAHTGQKFVLTDMRFKNELDMVKALGGTTCRIERMDHTKYDSHSSETEILTLPVDFVIRNDHTLERFQNDVAAIFHTY